MNKHILILKANALLFFLLLWGGKLNAQIQISDGTLATPSYLSELLKNLPQENALKFDTSSVNLSATLSIAINVVSDNQGKFGITKSEISSVINEANGYFKPMGVKFKVKTITNVGDYNYSYFSMNNIPTELMVKHSCEKTINLYLVDLITMGSQQYYGFTYFPLDTINNYIFLQKKYFTGSYLSCLLGHFLGLLSTHERKSGIEYANESNCSTKGDLICDTYADPDLLNLVSDSCLYVGSSRDPNGSYFVPSVANIMSNSPGECRCIFTLQQYRRMYFYYKKFRQYLR